MTKICLLSDTHGYIDTSIMKHIYWADEVWHAGDIGHIDLLERLEQSKPTRAVYGNIDGHQIRAACPENQIFSCEKVKVFIRHIGGYPGDIRRQPKRSWINFNPNYIFVGILIFLRSKMILKGNYFI